MFMSVEFSALTRAKYFVYLQDRSASLSVLPSLITRTKHVHNPVFCLNLFKSDTVFGQSFSSSRGLLLSQDGISWPINIISPGNYVFKRQVNYIPGMIEILVLCEVYSYS